MPDLQSLIDAAPDGATLTLSGDVVVSEAVILENRNDLTLVGDGTAVVRQAQGVQGKVVLVVGVSKTSPSVGWSWRARGTPQ